MAIQATILTKLKKYRLLFSFVLRRNLNTVWFRQPLSLTSLKVWLYWSCLSWCSSPLHNSQVGFLAFISNYSEGDLDNNNWIRCFTGSKPRLIKSDILPQDPFSNDATCNFFYSFYEISLYITKQWITIVEPTEKQSCFLTL